MKQLILAFTLGAAALAAAIIVTTLLLFDDMPTINAFGGPD